MGGIGLDKYTLCQRDISCPGTFFAWQAFCKGTGFNLCSEEVTGVQ